MGIIKKIKNTNKDIMALAAQLNQLVEGLFYAPSEDGSYAMDKTFAKTILTAVIASLISGLMFFSTIKDILWGNAKSSMTYQAFEPNVMGYIWHEISGAIDLGLIVVLVFLIIFAIKDIPKYENGKTRVLRGLFIFVWGLLGYTVVIFILTLLSLFYIGIFVVIIFAGGLAGITGGISEVLKNKTYKLDNGEKVTGDDILGYHDSHGNIYNRQGNEFKRK